MLLIDRRDQLTLIELMILSGVRMLLAFLRLVVNREGAKETRRRVTKEQKGQTEAEKQVAEERVALCEDRLSV